MVPGHVVHVVNSKVNMLQPMLCQTCTFLSDHWLTQGAELILSWGPSLTSSRQAEGRLLLPPEFSLNLLRPLSKKAIRSLIYCEQNGTCWVLLGRSGAKEPHPFFWSALLKETTGRAEKSKSGGGLCLYHVYLAHEVPELYSSVSCVCYMYGYAFRT